MSTDQSEPGGSEVFSVYGFRIRIPDDWRVEFNPKGNRVKGDVAFHSPKRNRIFLSWGPLEEATKRFRSIEEQRDWGVEQISKSRNIRKASVADSRTIQVSGHRALMTRVKASSGGGFLSSRQPDRTVSSMYLYCPNKSRYYILYSSLGHPEEYPDFPSLFDRVAQSMVCHTSSDGQSKSS